MELVPDGSRPAERADAEQFTGSVWRTEFISPEDQDHISGLRFDYEPGSHSAWHVHEREQAIVVVHGHGLIAWEGLSAPIEVGPGDWWHVEPGVPHWHGALPHTTFAHLAVTAGGGTTWLRGVTEDEYLEPPVTGPPSS
jgi:quercetin dioxygenase-like cupin family protein